MMRCERTGKCTMYLGDALKILPSIDGADLLVTDPPYKLTSGGNTTGEMGGCFDKENYDNSGSIVQCDIEWADFMGLMFAAMKDNTHAYIMANNRNVQPMINEAEKCGFY